MPLCEEGLVDLLGDAWHREVLTPYVGQTAPFVDEPSMSA